MTLARNPSSHMTPEMNISNSACASSRSHHDFEPEVEPLVPLLIASVFLYWSNTPAGSACSVSFTVVSTTVAASLDQVGKYASVAAMAKVRPTVRRSALGLRWTVTVQDTTPIASSTNAIGVSTRFISAHWLRKFGNSVLKSFIVNPAFYLLGARGLSIMRKLGRCVFEAKYFAVPPDALFHLRLAFFATRFFLP